MYNEQTTRFGTEIKNRVYDITGDVTDNHKWVPWDSVNNTSLKEQITKNYIMF